MPLRPSPLRALGGLPVFDVLSSGKQHIQQKIQQHSTTEKMRNCRSIVAVTLKDAGRFQEQFPAVDMTYVRRRSTFCWS